MSDNPLNGDTPLIIDGTEYTLTYDWAALSELAKRYGDNANLFDPKTLAGALEIGLKKHHKGVTAAHIIAASPPVVDAIAAFNAAMQRSYFGHKEPPQDATKNPLMGTMLNTHSTASPVLSPSHSALASGPVNSGA